MWPLRPKLRGKPRAARSSAGTTELLDEELKENQNKDLECICFSAGVCVRFL